MFEQAIDAARRTIADTNSNWLHKARFSDVSELENLFMPHAECVQLTLTPFSGEAISLKTEAVSILSQKTKSGGYQLRRHAAEGHLAIGYAERARAVMVNAQNCNPKRDVFLTRDAVVDLSVLGPSEFVWIDVDLSAVPELQSLIGVSGKPAIRASIDERAQADLRGYISAAVSMCFADPLLLQDPSMRKRVERDLIVRIVRALRQTREKPGPSKRETKMHALAQLVENFMWENVEERITLARICQSANCRTRSAIYCFKDVFGLGPITYLKIRRLNAVHKRLQEGDNRIRIIDVAADFGFWHMGHFSADYKRMFGKTASETLAVAQAQRLRARYVA